MDEFITDTYDYDFRVGDRVVAVAPVDGYEFLIGRAGTVVHISRNQPPIGVEFDEEFRGGHNCNSHGLRGRCRYGHHSDFEIESDNSREIEPDQEEKAVLDDFLSSYKK